jgi:hypothetical protein
MITLTSTLSELDWITPVQQEAVIQIMYFFGCFTESLPDQLLTAEKIEEFKTQEIDIEQVNSLMQAHLWRPQNVERSMLGVDARLHEDNLLSIELLKRYDALNMIEEIQPPASKAYDAILLLGSTENNFEARLDSLIAIMNTRNNTGPIYVLTSNRELWPLEEPAMARLLAARTNDSEQDINGYFNDHFPKDLIQNDTIRTREEAIAKSKELDQLRQAMYAHFRKMGVKIPTEVDMTIETIKAAGINIDTQNIIEVGRGHDGKRGNTKDTLVKFDEIYHKTHPEAKNIKILIVSSQPEALYQTGSAKEVLTPEKGYMEIDTLAAKAPADKLNPLLFNESIAGKVYRYIQLIKAKREVRINFRGNID